MDAEKMEDVGIIPAGALSAAVEARSRDRGTLKGQAKYRLPHTGELFVFREAY
jgi:hypothetical protein